MVQAWENADPTTSVGDAAAIDVTPSSTSTIGSRRRSISSKLTMEPVVSGCNVERFFYMYGKFYEKYFYIPISIGVIIAVVGLIGLSKFEIGSETIAKTWSKAGGELQAELEYTDKHSNEEWDGQTQAALITQRSKSTADYVLTPGGRTFTREVLEEMSEVMKTFFRVNVSVGNKSYTTRDLCSRQILPDTPPNPATCGLIKSPLFVDSCKRHEEICSGDVVHYDQVGNNTVVAQCSPGNMLECMGVWITCKQITFPCAIGSALECFSEAIEHQSDTWKYYETGGGDPTMKPLTQAIMRQWWGLFDLEVKFYEERPSFRSMTDAEIKHEVLGVLKGDPGKTGCEYFFKGYVASQSSDIVGDDDAVQRMVMYMDPVKRISWRMKDTAPDRADDASVKAALEKFPDKLAEAWKDLNSKLKYAKLGYLTSNAFDYSVGGEDGAPLGYIAVGYLLLLVLLGYAFGDPNAPFQSHIDLAFGGFALVVVSILAGFGYVAWFRITMNPFVLQSLPFLAAGLGVDDMIMMIRVFCHIDRASMPDGDGCVAVVLTEAGSGVTMTSVCNVIAFSLGTMLSIPGMISFCGSAAIIAAVNWLLMMTIMPGLLLLENLRMNKSLPEVTCFPCHLYLFSKAKKETMTRDNNDNLGFIEYKAHRFISAAYTGWICKPLVKYSLTFLSLCCFGLGILGAFNMEMGYDVHDIFFKDHPAYWFLKVNFDKFHSLDGSLCYKDIDWPTRQQDVIELTKDLQAINRSNGKKMLITGTTWLKSFALFAKNNLGEDLDTTYNDSEHAPVGLVKSSKFFTTFDTWARFPPKDRGSLNYVRADQAGALIFGLQDNTQPPNATNPIVYSCHAFTMMDLYKTPDYVEVIGKVRKTITNSPLKGKAFPQGTVFTFWEIFTDLYVVTWIAILLSVGVMFVVCSIFTMSILSGLIAAISSAMIVVEIWGVSFFFLKFSFFTSMPMLMAAGLSIEFTAHFVSIYARKDGTAQQRLNFAMQVAAPPTIMGGLTTLVAILPMALSPVPFLVKYFFAIFAIIILVGLVNSLIFLPAILAAVLGDRITDGKKKAHDFEKVFEKVVPISS